MRRMGLRNEFDLASPEFVDAYDEVSWWTGLTGRLLLAEVPMRPGQRVLDVGCGTGFPALILAERLGSSASVVGLDPWTAAIERARRRAEYLGIDNVTLVDGRAEVMPFADAEFDLIVSNVGLNNFEDAAAATAECFRVCRPGGTIALTSNLQGHMAELYVQAAGALEELGHSQAELQRDIAHRATVPGMIELLSDAGFTDPQLEKTTEVLRYADSAALLSHGFIKFAFLESWRKLGGVGFIDRLAERLDEVARRDGELRLTIPIAYVQATKPVGN